MRRRAKTWWRPWTLAIVVVLAGSAAALVVRAHHVAAGGDVSLSPSSVPIVAASADRTSAVPPASLSPPGTIRPSGYIGVLVLPEEESLESGGMVVRFSVPEERVHELSIEDELLVALDGAALAARVARIRSEVEPVSRTVSVDALLAVDAGSVGRAGRAGDLVGRIVRVTPKRD